jgi:hypothetical protein
MYEDSPKIPMVPMIPDMGVITWYDPTKEYHFVTIKDNVDENGSKSKDNIFEIMDGIIAQLNKTKKMLS